MSELGPLTSREVADRDALVLLLPLGSTEQHGPHLPLDTDTRIAVAVAAGIAGRIDAAVVAPPIAFGAAGEHEGFAGTLSVGTRVLSEMLTEIVRTAGPEFERIVVVNGHGGNAYALRSAAGTCGAEGRNLEVWSVRLPGADAHAGRTETSLMLAIGPDDVHLELAEAGASEPLGELLPKIMEGGVRDVSPNGVLGDPAGASAAEGARLLAALIDDAVTQILSGSAG